MRKRHDGWVSFLADHQELILATGLPPIALGSEDRFRRLLEAGRLRPVDGPDVSLDRLDDRRWAALEGLFRAFSREFESYEPYEQFLAFKHESRRRGSDLHA